MKTLTLAAVVCFCGSLSVGGPADPVSIIVFVCATISSIAGFAFSAISGSMLLHVVRDPVEAVQIMLVASIALQTYSVWALRSAIRPLELLPYFAGGAATVAPGIYLLLNTPPSIYLLALGGFLTAYGMHPFLRSPLRLQRNGLVGRIIVGALGGITGATAAFPGALQFNKVVSAFLVAAGAAMTLKAL